MSLSIRTDLATARPRRPARPAYPDPRNRAVYLTAGGLARLEAQRDVLTSVTRPVLSSQLRDAREFGASAENGELLAVREEEEILDVLIAHLTDLIGRAVVIAPMAGADGTVSLGAQVRLKTDSGIETFRILGTFEADPSVGQISNESPLGRALLGHRRRDRITWSAPSGVQCATLLTVRN